MAGYDSWDANSIAKISKYITEAMDQVLVQESKTNGMRAEGSMIEAGKSAKTIYLATPSANGAGNYSTTKGWTKNKGTLTWEAYTLRYDRGTSFLVDSLETAETNGLASVGMIANEFIRTQMVPEIDAVRLATASSVAVTEGYTNSETINKDNIVTRITEEIDNIYDRTGVDTGLTIYVNNKLKNVLNASSEYTKVRQIMEGPAGINTVVESINGNVIQYVPSTRMYSKIDLKDGQTESGYDKASDAVGINFLIAKPGSAQGVVSYTNTFILPKGTHTEGDGDFYGYRIYHDCLCPKQQRKGLYSSLATS